MASLGAPVTGRSRSALRIVLLLGIVLSWARAAAAMVPVQSDERDAIAPAPAADEAAPPSPQAFFGEQGQVVILATSTSGSISSQKFNGSDADFFNASVGIGVDYFVVRNITFGIDLEASYGDTKGYGANTLNETTSTHLAAGARFGVNLPLGSYFSWYPRITLGFSSNRSDIQTLSSSDGEPLPPPSSTKTIGPWVNVYAPLLVHPVSHFFLGLGPRIEHDFAIMRGGPYDGSRRTLISTDFVVGGWWGGASRNREDAPVSPVGETRLRSPTFGDEGHVVLTSATGASLSYTSYTRSAASSLDATFAPGFDYFVANHFSLGVDITVDRSSGSTFDSSGVRSDNSSTLVGVAPRLGVEIPAGEWMSLYAQAEVGYGSGSFHSTTARASNDHLYSRTWVALSAPVLVHAASHFFVGAGPYVTHDLSETDQNNYENDATLLGAKLVLGGWI